MNRERAETFLRLLAEAELRDLADRLRIVHTNAHDYAVSAGRAERDAVWEAHRQEFVSTVYETEHPAVRVHPEAGERSLLLGGFARTVAGFPPQASRDLIRVLQDYVTRPENTVRWHWRVGDLAIWDNRATQHYAIADYGRERRRGERVTVAGRHCEAGDEIARDVELPVDLHPGDLLAVACTGAYHHSMASNYNMVCRPPLVAVMDGRARELIRRETIDDLLSRDRG